MPGKMRGEELFTNDIFKIELPGSVTVGHFSRCSGLELSFEVFEYAEGGNNEFAHKLPGRLMHPNLVLSRGLTDSDALLEVVRPDQDQGPGRGHHADRPAAPIRRERSPSTTRSRSDGPGRRSMRTERQRSEPRRSRSPTPASSSPPRTNMAIPNGFQKAASRSTVASRSSARSTRRATPSARPTSGPTSRPRDGDLPDPEFGGGMPMTYKLSLLLDTSLDGPGRVDQGRRQQAHAGDARTTAARRSSSRSAGAR